MTDEDFEALLLEYPVTTEALIEKGDNSGTP